VIVIGAIVAVAISLAAIVDPFGWMPPLPVMWADCDWACALAHSFRGFWWHVIVNLAYTAFALFVLFGFGSSVTELRKARPARYDSAAALRAFRGPRARPNHDDHQRRAEIQMLREVAAEDAAVAPRSGAPVIGASASTGRSPKPSGSTAPARRPSPSLRMATHPRGLAVGSRDRGAARRTLAEQDGGERIRANEQTCGRATRVGTSTSEPSEVHLDLFELGS